MSLRSQSVSPGVLLGPVLLFRLPAANMASADADQTFTKIGSFTTYVITDVVAARATGAFNTLCLGGIYTAAAKGGSALIAAAQAWSALTGANTIVKATLAAILATGSYTATPILNLSTANGAALTADMRIYGYVVD